MSPLRSHPIKSSSAETDIPRNYIVYNYLERCYYINKISDAAVIGVEGEGTELPRAYVIADPRAMSEIQIKEYVKQNVASYKQLRGVVVFMDAIPKSASGKILRKELRAIRGRGHDSKL